MRHRSEILSGIGGMSLDGFLRIVRQFDASGPDPELPEYPEERIEDQDDKEKCRQDRQHESLCERLPEVLHVRKVIW